VRLRFITPAVTPSGFSTCKHPSYLVSHLMLVPGRLSVCIGAAIGPGGALGQRLKRLALGIPSARDGYPGWQRRAQ
jgi:hypothetical protein